MDFELKFPWGYEYVLFFLTFSHSPSEAKTRNCMSGVKCRIFVSGSADTQAFRWASPILLETESTPWILQAPRWISTYPPYMIISKTSVTILSSLLHTTKSHYTAINKYLFLYSFPFILLFCSVIFCKGFSHSPSTKNCSAIPQVWNNNLLSFNQGGDTAGTTA